MLGKLMKHEFRATARLMAPLFGVLILLAASVRVIDAVLADRAASVHGLAGSLLSMLCGLLPVAFVFAILGITIFSVILMVSRFYKNLMTDEGYLMFTLPVSVHGLLWSKLLVSIVWFIATFLVDILAIFLALAEPVLHFGSIFEEIAGFAPRFYQDFGIRFPVFCLELFAVGLLALVIGCLMFYAPISIGHSFANHKTLLSVVFYFVIQLAMQVLSISMLATGVFKSFVHFTVFRDSAELPLQPILLTIFLISLFFAAILYLITWLMLKRKRNLQ